MNNSREWLSECGIVLEPAPLSRLKQIGAVIARTTDRKTIALLNAAWWREYFKEEKERGQCE